jgi:hypothetical protein
MSSKLKNIENRGWEGMSTLLDKHLPQEKKKRAIFPFWSATAAASLFVISSLFVLKTSDLEKSAIVSAAKGIETNSVQEQVVNPKINTATENKINEVVATNSTDVVTKAEYINESRVQTQFDHLSFNTQSALNYENGRNSSPNSYLNSDLNTPIVESSMDNNVKYAQVIVNSSFIQQTKSSDFAASIPLENSKLELNQAVIINKGEVIDADQVSNSANVIAQDNSQSIVNEDAIDLSGNEDALTFVKSPIKNDFYISSGLNGIFNTEDKTKSASIGVDLGYKIKKLSVELGGEYITSNSVKLTPIEVNEYITGRSLNVQAIQLPIENLSKSTLISFKNGNLLALNLKMNYDLSNKLGLFAGLQRSQGTSLEELQFSNNSGLGTFDSKNQILDLSNQSSYSLTYVGRDKSSFSYILGLSYKILKRLNINVGVRSNYRPKNSINEYAVANNLPLFTVGASYKMF